MRVAGKVILAIVLILPLMVGGLSARAATEPEIETAIEDGLAWLAAEQQPDGSWGLPGWTAEGATGLAVLKFEERARDLGLDPFDPAYLYHQQVEDGLNYLLSGAVVEPGDLVWIAGSSWLPTYNTGIGMMALTASRNPGRIVTAPGPVMGWTYQAVLQGMLDWMADAQNDGTPGCECDEGGWGYNANDVCWSDQSNSGYATLGIGYAISPAYGFGVTLDPSVLPKLDTYVNNVQHPVSGGSGYGLSGSPPCGSDEGNILRTGNLLYEMALLHRPLGDPTVQAAIGFIENNWIPPAEPGWMGSPQAAFTMMKGLEAYQIETLGAGIGDWFDQVSTYIVTTQNPDGSWPVGLWGEKWLATAWNLLTLERVIVPPGCPESPLAPSSVEAILFPGESLEVEKCVETPEIPPMIDVCLLEDETGSFWDDIANLQGGTTASDIYDTVVAASPGAQFAVAGFRDYPWDPYGSPGDHVYRLLSSMSPIKVNWLNGIAGLTATGGNDTPEAQYDAIVAAAGPGMFDDPTLGLQDNCGWRPDPNVARVIVVATDAPFHLPGAGKPHVNDQASTVAALDAQNIAVVGLKAPGAGSELDNLVAALAAGGSVQPLSPDGSNIGAAIVAGLSNLPIDVAMETNCDWPISVTFDPPSQTVVSGSIVTFAETISVAADAPGGTYECDDWVTIDGEPLLDPETGEPALEHKTIKVPEGFLTGGGQIENGKGKNAEKISFGGNVGFLADFSLVGQWQTNFHNVAGTDLDKAKFHSTAITSLQFLHDGGAGPNPPPANANVGYFSATGRLNGVDGYTLYVCLADRGEPGRQNDSIRLWLASPGGAVVYDSLHEFESQDNGLPELCEDRHLLDAGNFQIHSGLKE